MPLLIARRVLVSNRWWFFGCVLAYVALLALILNDLASPVEDRTASPGMNTAVCSIPLLLIGADSLWVGRKRVAWFLAPWRTTRHRDVVYYDGALGEGLMAEMERGDRRRVFHHGGSYFASESTDHRRVQAMVSVLETARVRAGGNPNPVRRTRHRTPLGRS